MPPCPSPVQTNPLHPLTHFYQYTTYRLSHAGMCAIGNMGDSDKVDEQAEMRCLVNPVSAT